MTWQIALGVVVVLLCMAGVYAGVRTQRRQRHEARERALLDQRTQ